MTIIYKDIFLFIEDNTNQNKRIEYNLKDCFLPKVISFKAEKNYMYQICK